MTNQERSSAETLFEAVLDLPPGRRTAFLDKACRGAPEVRRLVDDLLLENERAGGFLSEALFSPVGDAAWTTAPDPVRLAAGSTLGRYSIIEALGAGGMGVVYRARDEKLERAVAIKILSPGVLTNEDARRRFHKEALALAKLSHTHIAAVYDVGQQEGIDYIVMECVPGESLAARLKSGPLSVKDATSIAMQVAQALEEAHEQGVIHRDLKPANVMVTPKGQVKVLDFGIAKLLSSSAAGAMESITETRGIIGTPLYMSPEQAYEKSVDARTDLWSLGVLYYESLAGCAPFQADSSLGILRAIAEQAPAPLRQLRPDTPALAEQIVSRALEKDPASRYQSASEIVRDTSDLLARLTTTLPVQEKRSRGVSRAIAVMASILLLFLVIGATWAYRRWSAIRWAREEAIPEVNQLLDARKPLAASFVLERAQKYLPSDPRLQEIADQNTRQISITSSPAGARVEIQDYDARDNQWHSLGMTPLQKIAIPKGYFRWRVSKPGTGEMIVAPPTASKLDFQLGAAQSWPKGMVLVPGHSWTGNAAWAGWLGPYKLPPYYADRYEVTNREYQKFVDSGGYEKQQYWIQPFIQDGHTLSWNEAMAQFRDTSGRPGPSTWVAGHYPEGKADYPVAGVSWFEASAYAAFAGKSLPVLAQSLDISPLDYVHYIAPVSNLASGVLAPVGTYRGIGPYGTYDNAGNVREWSVNVVNDNLRFLMGGSFKSPPYAYTAPAPLSPFDRSEDNGFRCVQNLGPLPVEATTPVKQMARDFSHFKPASDTVFKAYQLLYAYEKSHLNARAEGLIKETADWREEKVSFDTAYRGERMTAYLFLPKNVKPPYQTVLFFPSARIYFGPDNKGGLRMGDMSFFDYLMQSGRAVMYPTYEDTYERQVKFTLPSGDQNIQLTTDWYKDAARSLDYLATRSDIDNSKLAYLGVSMGSVQGVIISTLEQNRLKTAVLIDGGFFLDPAPPGGDEADFAPRMKKPVLMVNGRYDSTFPVEKSQDPLFALLGTPAADKRHVVLDTPHDATEDLPHMSKTVLAWLDHYLGRVGE